MARLFVKGELVQGDVVALGGEQAHYLKNVLRMKPGDEAFLIDDAGSEYLCEVCDVGKRRVKLVVGEKRADEPPPTVSIDLYVGLMKGNRMERLVRDASALGVRSIVPITSERAIPQNIGEVKIERLRKIAVEEARLSGQKKVVTINAPLSFSDALLQTRGVKIIFWEDGGEDIRAPLREDFREETEFSLITGPEGGLSVREVEEARGAGFRVMGLGAAILRAEFAPIVVATIILYEKGGFSKR